VVEQVPEFKAQDCQKEKGQEGEGKENFLISEIHRRSQKQQDALWFCHLFQVSSG
jgi:hypothetical protein